MRAQNRRSGTFDEILVGYADCGTGGLLDKVCAEENVEMLAGAHCYQFFATAARFDELQDHSARQLLPDRLPRPKLGAVDLGRHGDRQAPRAARHVLRQLHPVRVSRSRPMTPRPSPPLVSALAGSGSSYTSSRLAMANSSPPWWTSHGKQQRDERRTISGRRT